MCPHINSVNRGMPVVCLFLSMRQGLPLIFHFFLTFSIVQLAENFGLFDDLRKAV